MGLAAKDLVATAALEEDSVAVLVADLIVAHTARKEASRAVDLVDSGAAGLAAVVSKVESGLSRSNTCSQ